VEPTVRGSGLIWAVYTTTCCEGFLSAKGPFIAEGVPIEAWGEFPIEAIYPGSRRAAPEIPEPARYFLQQAFETLHAPDAAVMVAGSAVDAMLKHRGLTEGSVHARIEEAVKKNILTPAMGEWAHVVRLESNRPRHADEKEPHVSPEEAQQSVEFTDALGLFLFVLSSRIKIGLEAAKKANAPSRSRVKDRPPRERVRIGGA
jgi:hypothetical protein